MTYCIGLTGNAASGKSTVAALFNQLGVHIISADAISRELCTPNQEAYQQILAHFGPEILQKDGSLDRKSLRNLVVSEPTERQWLEQLLHPLIRARILQDLKHCQSLYSMIEIPLLSDRKTYPYLNRILLITAPLSLQVARLIQRDASSEEQALSLLSLQGDRSHIADDVLCNDKDLAHLQKKIENLHAKYLQEAKKIMLESRRLRS